MIDPVRALDALLFAVSYDRRWPWLETRSAGHGENAQSNWTRVDGPTPRLELARRILRTDARLSRETRISLGRREDGHRSSAAATVAWVVTHDKDGAGRLARFSRKPTIVMREGSSSRLHALWLLDQAYPHEDVVRANKRLAYALRTRQNRGDPDEVLFPAPGTCLRSGCKRPIPVGCEVLEGDRVYGLGGLVRGLKDPPDPDAWKTRAA